MGRRVKQSLKRRSKTHRTEVLKLRKRKSRRKKEGRRHRNRARSRKGGKKN